MIVLERPEILINSSGNFDNKGGQFSLDQYFSGNTVSPFFGIAYKLNDKVLLKIEKDTTAYDKIISYENPSSDYSFGVDYEINNNFSVGLAYERGIYSSLRFVYKNNPINSVKKYKYKKAKTDSGDSKYSKLIKNLEENGIGVNKITETSSSIGLELTQFIHSI